MAIHVIWFCFGQFPPLMALFSIVEHIFFILKAMAKKAKSILTLSIPKCRNRLYAMLYFICPKTASANVPMEGEVKHQLCATVTPAQHEHLVAENALPVHVGEYLADGFHLEARLWKVRVVGYQHGRQPAFLVVATHENFRDEPIGDAVDHVSPIDVVLRL